MNKKTQLIILAAGKGERFGGNIPKQFVKIAGKTIIEHTIDSVEKSDVIDSIIIVIHKEFYDYMNDLALKNHYRKVKKIIIGGNTRQESSYAGILACDEDTENVLFHDAIRPFISEEILENIVIALDTYKAIDVAIPCADTIIQIDDNMMIRDIPKRKYLMRGQTPQAFKKSVIMEAYQRFMADKNLEVTDDCGIVRHYNLADIYVVNGSEQNIKVTHQEDIYLADKLFQIHSIDGTVSDESFEDNIKQLREKVGVIFGASSGIGADVLQYLNENGCKAYGYSRKNGCDITNYDEIENVLKSVHEKEGRIDYIINTTGDLKVLKLEAMDIAEIEELLSVNYKGVIYLTKAAIPYLKETGGMMIHFTSSSYTRGRALYSIYSSAKAAVVNFAQAMSEELMEDGIRINVINPERTKTAMRIKNFGNEPEATLLDSRTVARVTINTVCQCYTGQVIDVRRK